jgi:Cyclic nucleotide-binding domain
VPHDSPLVRLHRAFDVRAGEGTPILFLMALSLGAGMFAALFFTAANASFLAHFEIRILPYAYIVSALVGAVVTGGFSLSSRRLRFGSLVVGSLVGVAALLFLSWLGLRFVKGSWVSFLLFVWIDPLVTVVDLGFWGLCGRLFDLQQAKRLSGLVSSGEVVSAILGFCLVPALLRVGSLSLLVLVATFAVGGCAVIAVLLTRRFHGPMAANEERERGAATGASGVAGGGRYVPLICAVVVLTVVTLYFVDFSLLTQVRRRFASAEAVGRFLALYWGAARGIELFAKTVLSGRLLGHFGLLFGLLSLPAAVVMLGLLASLAGLVGGTATSLFFVLVAVTRLVEFVCRRSFFDPSLKVLFQPLGERLRFAVQILVDGPVRQLGLLVAGVALLLIALLPSLGIASVVAVTTVLALGGSATTLLAFREYRKKLLEALATRTVTTLCESPVELIRRTLGRSDPVVGRYGVEVLLRVDPGLAHGLLRARLADADAVVRREALGSAQRNLMVAVLPDVEALAAVEPDPEVRQAAESTRGALQEVADLARSPERIDRLVVSADDRDRVRAALAAIRSAASMSRQAILELLWDRNPQVRRIALVAAGRSGRTEYLPRIVEHLPTGQFCQSAAAALIAGGQTSLPALELAFSRYADRPDVLLRILRIYARLRGPEAERRLFASIDHPNHDVQGQALRSLSTTDFQARDFQVPLVRAKVEQSIGRIAWYTAATRDLGTRPDLAAVTAALDEQLREERDSMFLLLGLICEPDAVRMMQESLGSTGDGGRGYALEIAAEVTPQELHEILFPVFEGLGAGLLLDRLALVFPQKQLSAGDRLRDLLAQGYDRANTWTRACAVATLAEDGETGIPAELVANLFHPDPMIRELVAAAMRRRDPEGYRRYLERLPERVAADLDAVTGELAGRRLRVFERVNLLRQTAVFAGVPVPILAGLAHDLTETRLPAETLVFSQGDVGLSMYVVAEGGLAISQDGRVINSVGPCEVLGEIATLAAVVRSASVHSTVPTRLLEIDRDQILNLLADHLEVLPGLIEVITGRLANRPAKAA